MHHRSASHAARLVLYGLLVLSGCSSLPSSGPSDSQVVDRFNHADNPLGVQVVQLTPEVVRRLHDQPERSLNLINRLRSNRPVDRLGPGDVLSVTVYESGPGLFGARRPSDGGNTPPGSSGETLPQIQVDRAGHVDVPYAGSLSVLNRTTGEVQRMIEGRLAGQTASPQVLVSLVSNNSNIVYVSGDVHSPGRYGLSLAPMTLLDVVALSGGPTHSPQDTVVKMTRRGQEATTSLNRVQTVAAENIPVEPQDRIQVEYRPRSYMSFGATGRVTQVPFDAATVSLAEAVARTGGLDDQRANPEAVFLFRFEDPDNARAITPSPPPPRAESVPLIYRVNMRDAQTYFTMQQFTMRDKDLIYVANAPTVQLYKFLQLIYTFATPAFTAKTLAN